jgi:hypothetical protein
MRFIRWTFALAGALLLASCSSLRPDVNQLGRKVSPVALTPQGDIKTRFDAASAPNSSTAAQMPALRRELASSLIAQSDRLCEDYLTGVSVVRNGYATGLGVGALSFSAAGGVTTPVRSANLLSAIASLLTGANTNVSSTLFGGREYPLIYAAVKTGRRAQRDRIITEIEKSNGDYSTWGYHSILALVEGYHSDCGVNYGLQRMNALANGATDPSD